MRVRVEVTPGGKTMEVEIEGGKTTVRKLLNVVAPSLGVPAAGLVATRDGEVLLEDDVVRDGDLIKLYRVVSGG